LQSTYTPKSEAYIRYKGKYEGYWDNVVLNKRKNNGYTKYLFYANQSAISK